jgi:hypothetical protein
MSFCIYEHKNKSISVPLYEQTNQISRSSHPPAKNLCPSLRAKYQISRSHSTNKKKQISLPSLLAKNKSLSPRYQQKTNHSPLATSKKQITLPSLLAKNKSPSPLYEHTDISVLLYEQKIKSLGTFPSSKKISRALSTNKKKQISLPSLRAKNQISRFPHPRAKLSLCPPLRIKRNKCVSPHYKQKTNRSPLSRAKNKSVSLYL